MEWHENVTFEISTTTNGQLQLFFILARMSMSFFFCMIPNTKLQSIKIMDKMIRQDDNFIVVANITK
jgi:hypothetical protein